MLEIMMLLKSFCNKLVTITAGDDDQDPSTSTHIYKFLYDSDK